MHTRVSGWEKDDYLTRLVFRSLVIGDFNAIYEYSRIVCLRSCATAGDFDGRSVYLNDRQMSRVVSDRTRVFVNRVAVLRKLFSSLCTTT